MSWYLSYYKCYRGCINEAKVVYNEIREQAVNSHRTTISVITSVVNKVSAPVVNRLPQVDSLARTVRKIRGTKNSVPKDPEKNTNFAIPQEFPTTTMDDFFPLYDSETEKNRLLMFSNDKNLQELEKSEIWAGDGKFSVVPQAFAQLYTIHGNSSGQFLPLVYVLTSDRTEKPYKKVLKKLKEFNANLKPGIMLVDYEPGFIATFRKVFQDCTMRGCYCHFRKAVYAKIQKYGLLSEYTRDAEFARDLRKLNALAIVPKDRVVSAFVELLKTPFL
ncbi:uncharacterized protein LOC107043998 [Diachasma alloeum]|uniref:uncharacterized protein LOC107043998 n=1 Tax=Diachasma alloeum TaxID=454923 RepID=UPI000738238E|nr:uncharacterized protein LOC107043998 [Diachasma alloeum]